MIAVDSEQVALDLEDAEAKLRLVAKAVEQQEHFRMQVQMLTRQLKEAKRLLKEAGWEVSATAKRVAEHCRRRGRRVQG